MLFAGSRTTGRQFVDNKAEEQCPHNGVDTKDSQANKTEAQDSAAGVVIKQAYKTGNYKAYKA